MDFSIITGVTGNASGNKTWDSEFGFIYQFIDIIEKLFQVIANFFNSLSGNAGAGTETPDAGATPDEVVPA